MPTIVPPAVRHKIGTNLRELSPVTLADLSSARHKQSEDFGGQRVFGLAVGCSTFDLMVQATSIDHVEDRRLRREFGATSIPGHYRGLYGGFVGAGARRRSS